MKTWHIHITGQVQGVGFRPFVFLLAHQHGLYGWVNNASDGVHVEFNADKESADRFYRDLVEQSPHLSRITGHSIREIETKAFKDFQIVHSHLEKVEAPLLLTPDFGICDRCREELSDPQNRRFQYPFITCTHCGPRFSIIKKLPYDRETTTMEPFGMCPVCRKEYDDPTDRRYYSQTNSCPDCAVELSLFDNNGNWIAQNQDAIANVVQNWKEGKIVAIKGIGGYLLTCDANNEAAIATLRQRKHRPTKPFALMYPNLETLESNVILLPEEKAALGPPEASIVLLNAPEGTFTQIARESIAPNLDQIGVMLPYTPLFELLLQAFGKPIVATSGNVSNSPIVFEDDTALKDLRSIADFILTNNRSIVVPQDDSVITHSPFLHRPIVLRRSRGFAPTYINPALKWLDETILATGAMLKSTFALLHKGNTYISQYLGDLEHFDTLESYRHTLAHFLQLFDLQPEVIIADKHPEYPSARFGKQMADELQIPFFQIQHHLAHFGAVLGENNLIESTDPVLGIIWDGTGLGDDGQIWGGEFFYYKNHQFERIAHFEYFDFILGDKMPREPRISALSACWGLDEAFEILKEKFTPTEWNIYTKILTKDNPLKTSSVGRLFDAVASMLGIMDIQTFEGEAAMQLEKLARRYFRQQGLGFQDGYFQVEFPEGNISIKTLIGEILTDVNRRKPIELIAAKFHYTLVQIVKNTAEKSGAKKLAFAGGVFQNGLLVDLLLHHLGNDFELYFHHQLSPNDESVSFGQLVCHQIQSK